MSQYRAFEPPPRALEIRGLSELCGLHVIGLCRDSTRAPSICVPGCHVIYRIEDKEPVEIPLSSTVRNTVDSMKRMDIRLPFEEDGPGLHAAQGVRHDNDHASIADIKILPTTDEILCARQPYMPVKLDHAPHRLPCGPERLMDIHFRHLRYENIALICDVFYDAIQTAISSKTIDQHLRESAGGARYSLFQNVEFESISFHERLGAVFHLSYNCPSQLRGHKMYKGKTLEERMLCGLVAVHEDSLEVNVIFYKVILRESTLAMFSHTGNHSRASVHVCVADDKDIAKLCQSAYYAQGIYKAKFFLVDLPGILLAGFVHHLERLQALSVDGNFAFRDQIAPGYPGLVIDSQPPESPGAWHYNLNCLKKQMDTSDFFMDPQQINAGQNSHPVLEELKSRTTLDEGQAIAFYENLNRKMAFTQGPPGTGKTYLGVKEVQVILDSRVSNKKPVVVVCMTNHALDDFIASLKESGVTRIARLGAGSTAKWMPQHLMPKVRRQVRKTRSQEMQINTMRASIEGLRRQGFAFAESLSSKGADPWVIIADHLRANQPDIFEHFVRLDSLDKEQPSIDLRQAKILHGFAFKFWLDGGDVQDVDGLIEVFETILGKSELITQPHQESDLDRFKIQVSLDIRQNVREITSTGSCTNLWTLNLDSRKMLAATWLKEANPYKICEAFAEIHRRHQELMGRQYEIYDIRDCDAIERAGIEVLAMTSTGCARNSRLLNLVKPQVMLFEEASELTEAHSICALVPSVKHCIQIGDPLQLRPQVNQMQLSVDNDNRYRLDESLFERLWAEGMPFSKLNTQRRAHPEMADLLRAGDYPYLIDHESTKSHPPVAGMFHRMFWYDHGQPEDNADPLSVTPKSYSNRFEVKFICAMVKYLVLQQGYKFQEITVLTPYNGQIAALTEELSEICTVSLTEADRGALIDAGLIPDNEQDGPGVHDVSLSSMLRIATVDNYQGEQARVILFSVVRSNHQNAAGFLKNHNRINVAISRAEDGFYVVGNSHLITSASEHWAKIVKVFETKNLLGDALPIRCAIHNGEKVLVRKPGDFNTNPVCESICSLRLPCGHICPSLCHPLAMHNDGRLPCLQNCTRLLDCGHKCENACGMRCGPCLTLMAPTTLPCGHTVQKTCESGNVTAGCSAVIEERSLKCGHTIKIQCSEKNINRKCTEICGTLLPCGHNCASKCTQCSTLQIHQRCELPCGKTFSCSHKCAMPCHKGSCEPCQQRCLKRCRHGPCKEACIDACDPCAEPGDYTDLGCERSTGKYLICSLSSVTISYSAANIAQAQPICDRLYAKCGKVMAEKFREVSLGEDLVFLKFDKWCLRITTGPLSGSLNQRLINERSKFMKETQHGASKFRDEVVTPVEYSIIKVYGAVEDPTTFPSPALSFKLRFDFIYLYSRMVMVLFGHHLVCHLNTLDNADKHTRLLARGLVVLIAEQAKGEVEGLETRIAMCEILNLKRLETEMRLMQLCFWTILRAHGAVKTVKIDVYGSLTKMRSLITRFPRTAGILKGGYTVMAEHINFQTVPNRLSAVFLETSHKMWAQWGTYDLGSLIHCKFQHPYSTVTFSEGCPECGEEERDPFEFDRQVFLHSLGLA